VQNHRILISGASIAGPSLAYWLNHFGFQTTVVEHAPALRGGGFGVDFRGPVHLGLLERMAILDDIRRHQTHMGEVAFIDADGRINARMPSFVVSGDVEIERGDLSRILYDITRGSTEYVFGDSITSLVEDSAGVRVTFHNSAPRTFDLVIGADGLHSNVRRLVWGDERQFLRFAGWYFAGGVDMPNEPRLDHRTLSYSEPGRTLSLSSGSDPDVADVSFVFASDQLAYDRHDIGAQKAIVAERFAGMGWLAPRALAALQHSPSLYFDALAQIRMDAFVRGRIALVGDAAYGATLGGLGTGLAMVGAYVLAGELAAAGGDHQVGFATYQRAIEGYARGCQKLADGAGPFLAPRTKGEIRRRNVMYRVLSSRLLSGFFNGLTTKAARAIALKDYRATSPARATVGLARGT
jgi:2-polyprenyl-6-methoxyphenol hydroxylase-like FAD-dependent oxidoreductase